MYELCPATPNILHDFSPQSPLENGLIKDLSNAIDGLEALGRYCCGGSVSLATCDIATIRWDELNEEGISRKIEVPIRVRTTFFR